MIIITACDRPYFIHSKALMASIRMNTRHDAIQYLIAAKSEDPDKQKDYCANIRTRIIFDLVHAGQATLWLDADSLVRGSLDPLEKILREEADVIAVRTPEMAEGGYEPNEWLISTVGVAATPAGKEFAAVWFSIQNAMMAEETYAPSIMTCQAAFVRAVKRLEKKVRILDIGYGWSDKFMRDQSAIWEAQGPRKEEPRWKMEQEKYL